MAKTNPARLSVEDMITRVLQQNQLFFDCDVPYLKHEEFFERISEKDAKRYIVNQLTELEKMSTPKSDYQETLDRLSLLDRLQLHLSENLMAQQFLVNVANGVFNAKTGELTRDRANYRFCYCCDFNYHKGSNLDQAPAFKRYLKTSVGEANTRCFLKCMAFLLSDIVDAKKAIFIVGDGNT